MYKRRALHSILTVSTEVKLRSTSGAKTVGSAKFSPAQTLIRPVRAGRQVRGDRVRYTQDGSDLRYSAKTSRDSPHQILTSPPSHMRARSRPCGKNTAQKAAQEAARHATAGGRRGRKRRAHAVYKSTPAQHNDVRRPPNARGCGEGAKGRKGHRKASHLSSSCARSTPTMCIRTPEVPSLAAKARSGALPLARSKFPKPVFVGSSALNRYKAT